jgi:ABC-type nitrate/sulfonate/bicarbonate transport system substrate-binding protein
MFIQEARSMNSDTSQAGAVGIEHGQRPSPIRRNLLRAAGAALGASMLQAPFVVRAQSRAMPGKIELGYLPANTILMVFNQGTDIWRQQGLNIDFKRFTGGPEILNAVASASIPVAEVGVGPALLAALKGAPLVFFTLGSISGKGYPFSRVMVRGDSNIRSFADLANKRLALHQRGTMEHLTLGAAERKFGLAPASVQVSLVPFPNQPQVLAQNQVDAIYTVPPFDVIAEKKFNARTLVETVDFVPYLGYSTLAMHKSFVAEYPEAVDKLLQAWIRYSRWVDDNTDEARRASSSFLNIAGDIAPGIRVPYYARNGLPVMPNVWHIYHMYLAAKIIEPADNVAKTMEEYFILPAERYTLKALDAVGRQPDPVVKDFLNTRLPLLPNDNSPYLARWERDLTT